jgi:prepilin peptidase CpaA
MTTLSHWVSLFVLEQPRLLVLAALLLAAAWIDSYAWRIPNVLTFGGSAAALFLSVLEPVAPGQALLLAFGGLALGLLVMLPMYLLGALGAGDVKLMAMVGAYLGAVHTVGAALLVFLTGGALAFALVMRRQAWPQLWSLLGSRWRLGGQGASELGRMPYGASICLGTFLYVVWVEPKGLQWSRWFAV